MRPLLLVFLACWSILLVTVIDVDGRTLFFGVSQGGKTELINQSCGLQEPVAQPMQYTSTTVNMTTHPCLNSAVIDSIGLFDYRETGSQTMTVAFTLKTILSYVAQPDGLTSMVFVLPSREPRASRELESLFTKVQSLLPPGLPIAIVDNQFEGPPSGLPDQFAKQFDLPIIRASKTNVVDLQAWIKDHAAPVFHLKLPVGWEKLIDEDDLTTLRQQLARATLIGCGVVKNQLDLHHDQMKKSPRPVNPCGSRCHQDCSVCTRGCHLRVFGVCVHNYKDCRQDANCLKAVTECRTACQTEYQAEVASYDGHIKELTTLWQDIHSQNKDLLKLCDDWKQTGHLTDEL